MDAAEFDAKFDRSEDITEYLDFSKARRPGREQQDINISFPQWMIEALDREAKRLGVARQDIIKVWLAERLERVA
ncbi:MAG: CopG family transcriptional regulator [Leptolyngbya foveolarum]|uniref:CopG family transcriptional regulator n=1 Tax=Leptolyngbya foveolarum TaxID=47253 RepID=A0A2W4VDR3_9CYAN|nr:MAG: CopG family transcriptional regulator [Leptolyngbya foveolarum]